MERIMEQSEIEQRVQIRKVRRILNNARESAGVKSGIIYVLLAFFVCVIGLHNFYAGYAKRGFTQLFLTIVSPFFMFFPLLAVACWGLLEMLLVNKSANGKFFSGNRAVIWGLRVLGVGLFVYSFMNAELIFEIN